MSVKEEPSASKIAKDSFVVLVGTAGSMAFLFVTQILVGRLIGITAFAIVSLIISLAYIISDLADFGLKSTIVRDLSSINARRPEDAPDYISTIFSLKIRITTIALLFSPIAIYVSALTIFNNSMWFDAIVFSTVGVTSGVLLTVSWFLRSYFQSLKKFLLYSAYSLVGNSIFFALVVFGFILGQDETSLPFLLLLSYGIWLLGGLFLLRGRYQSGRKTSEFRKRILSFSKWIMASSIIVTIVNRVDQLIVASLLPYEDVAMYGAAILIAQLIPLLTTSISTVLFPTVSEIRTKVGMNIYLRKTLVVSIGLSIILFLPVILFPVPVSLFFGVDYVTADSLFPIMGVAFLLGLATSPLSLVPLAVDRPDTLTYMNLIQLILTLILLPLLILTIGLVGAAFNVLIIRLLTPVYLGILTYLIMREKIRIKSWAD
ncbi:MAG: oligosaccharide flippase family protein [Promethearchaeota archaeon]